MLECPSLVATPCVTRTRRCRSSRSGVADCMVQLDHGAVNTDVSARAPAPHPDLEPRPPAHALRGFEQFCNRHPPRRPEQRGTPAAHDRNRSPIPAGSITLTSGDRTDSVASSTSTHMPLARTGLSAPTGRRVVVRARPGRLTAVEVRAQGQVPLGGEPPGDLLGGGVVPGHVVDHHDATERPRGPAGARGTPRRCPPDGRRRRWSRPASRRTCDPFVPCRCPAGMASTDRLPLRGVGLWIVLYLIAMVCLS
jgi:hypothetical protein